MRHVYNSLTHKGSGWWNSKLGMLSVEVILFKGLCWTSLARGFFSLKISIEITVIFVNSMSELSLDYKHFAESRTNNHPWQQIQMWICAWLSLEHSTSAGPGLLFWHRCLLSNRCWLVSSTKQLHFPIRIVTGIMYSR